MELTAVNHYDTLVKDQNESTNANFMGANTQAIDGEELFHQCIIPSFAKDNESTISHTEFLEVVHQAASSIFSNEQILSPAIRVSHPIKGRIPEAMGKPAKELLEHEKTLYYERMAFIFEIPTISETVSNNQLSLTVGGVRAYNLENLYSKKSEERFKIFIGFQNKVCTNLCISTDGFLSSLKVRTTAELLDTALQLFASYKADKQLLQLSALDNYAISEKQFAHLVGKARMYQFLSPPEKKKINPVPINDSQISTVVKDYYADEAFCKNENGDIDLWKLYNLFTGANKSSYIDTFLEREVGCLNFVETLFSVIQGNNENWYLQ